MGILLDIDTMGDPVPLTAQRLRRFAKVFFCDGWMVSRRLTIQPSQKNTLAKRRRR